MSRFNSLALLIALLATTTVWGQITNQTPEARKEIKNKPAQSDEGDIIPNQYIVVFKTSSVAPANARIGGSRGRDRQEKGRLMLEQVRKIENEIDVLLAGKGIAANRIKARYTAAFAGASLTLTPEQYKNLKTSDGVESIEPDRVVKLPPYEIESVGGGARAQLTPCAITNAGGAAPMVSQDRWIWVVDTGIDLDHPDLNVVTNPTYAKSFVGGTPDDCDGHGTHVAGIAAARNNTIGSVGIAPGAPVVPVKVLGCTGTGSITGILNGLNHVATYDYAGDVVNLSLGNYYGASCATASAYRTIVQAMSNAGTRIAIAAGNSADYAPYYEPGCINGANIYTVASMNCNKTWSSFSNYGRAPIDWIATGSSVYSTYKNGGYATLSGTSMAAPIVAGILQLRDGPPVSGGNVTYKNVAYPIARRQ